jgi:hypothetical protein
MNYSCKAIFELNVILRKELILKYYILTLNILIDEIIYYFNAIHIGISSDIL